MAKKLLSAFIIFIFCINAFANHEQKSIRVKFTGITSSSGYCSFIVRIYPFDKQTVPGYPVSRLGAGPINRYLFGVSADKKSYVEFGYFDPSSGSTTWFPSSCKITLDKSSNITVNIAASTCSYTNSSGG